MSWECVLNCKCIQNYLPNYKIKVKKYMNSKAKVHFFFFSDFFFFFFFFFFFCEFLNIFV